MYFDHFPRAQGSGVLLLGKSPPRKLVMILCIQMVCIQISSLLLFFLTDTGI